MNKPAISICIPSYNRSQFLKPLLDSILAQDFDDYEIIICEDMSPQREQIKEIICENYDQNKKIKLFLNEQNLGYDANFRELLNKSSGEYCFFMGNDDLMAPGALKKVFDASRKYSNIGLFLRSYSWFFESSDRIAQSVHYFSEDRIFPPGGPTISTAYRRCGVLSGYVIHRETALKFSTSEFDGFLYYQMYLAACILNEKKAYYINDVLTFSRATEAPDFGNSVKEKAVFTPGAYTPSARIHMVKGMLTIAKTVESRSNVDFYQAIESDIANYVYPYISDQLKLKPLEYLKFYREMGNLGLKKHKMFHIHIILAYLLKERGYDKLTKFVREKMGRTPDIGGIYSGEPIKQ